MGLKKKRDLQDLNEYPEDIKNEYLFLSDWVRELAPKYKGQILIRVIDMQSFQGFLKSIRYGIHRYPTFIINQKRKYHGMDKEKLDTLLQEELSAQSMTGSPPPFLPQR